MSGMLLAFGQQLPPDLDQVAAERPGRDPQLAAELVDGQPLGVALEERPQRRVPARSPAIGSLPVRS